MKALTFTTYGRPDLLELRDVPDPSPAENELLVRVRASSINSWDWEYLNGVPFANRAMFGLLRPKPGKRRLGADIAGVVEAVGPGVTRFTVGDAVFGDLWDNWGGFAELACIGEDAVERVPENITFEQAAAVPQAGVLALSAYRKAPNPRAGMRVCVNGAGGGVGTFAIQLARLDGAEVTGVDAPHKLEAIASLGADHVIDYTREHFTKSGRRYDLIIDCQLSRPLSECKRALAPGGRYAVIGGDTWRIMRVMLQRRLFPLGPDATPDARCLEVVMDGPNKGLDHLRDLMEAGAITPVIDSTFPLENVVEALQYFGAGRHTGKVVITVSS